MLGGDEIGRLGQLLAAAHLHARSDDGAQQPERDDGVRLEAGHGVAARAEQQERAADDENRRADIEQQREDERAYEVRDNGQKIPAECSTGTSATELCCVERNSFATVRCAAVGRNLKYSAISVRVTEACSHQRVGGKLSAPPDGDKPRRGSASDSSARLRGM